MPDGETKIILFRPEPYPVPSYRGAPLSLLAISSLIPQKKYDIKIFDGIIDKNYKEKILNSMEGAVCLGISSMTGYQIHAGLKVAEAVKENYPDIPIVWGGFHPSIFPKQTVQNPFVDILIKGQGEITFAELVNHLKNNLSLKNILGIAYKENGRIIQTSDRQLEDINKFLPLPYHLIDVDKCVMKTDFGERTINYISSQGCPFNCKFCAEPMVFKRRWNALKPDRVLNELESLVKNYDIDSVVFNDSNFFVSEERTKQICKGLIKRKLDIKWGLANGRTDQLCRYSKETWKLMKKSGCNSFLIGAESGSQKVLDFIGKGTTVEDTIKFAKICKKYDIKPIYSFMIGFPQLPSEFQVSIDEEFEETMALINKLHSIYENYEILWFFYTPYPGSPIYDLSIKAGFKEPKNLKEWANLELWEENTPWLNRKYVGAIKQLNRYIFQFCSANYFDLMDKITEDRPRLFRATVNNTFKVLRCMAYFRFKHKFFSIPVEYGLIRATSFLYKKYKTIRQA